jgi:ABC-type uncharacterized transport system substrate-binding protein
MGIGIALAQARGTLMKFPASKFRHLAGVAAAVRSVSLSPATVFPIVPILFATSLEAGAFRLLSTQEPTIADIHAAIKSKDLTCRQLVQMYLDRIDAYDKKGPAPNAIVVVNPNALSSADILDARFANSGFVGPLHCVPMIIKDNYDVVGLPTTAGSLSLKDSMPPRDAFQVRKLREVGALVLAKSNMAEFAVSPYETVGSLLPGYTRNPYALDRVPAGSSGGTAVAVAASFGAAGLGTDTGNSIRGPSSHTSLVGIRSTMGLTSRDGIVPRQLHRDIGGPIARTVADAAAIFDVIAGSDPADPVTSSPAILAAKGATTTIPIVFGFGADPIETGLVSSLDHPGGNITGVTSMTVGIGSKRLGLLLDLVPRATGVAVLVDPNDDATVVRSMIADVRGAAIPVGRGIEVFYARDVDDIDAAFTGLVEKRSEVLFVSPSSFFSSHRMEIVALAARHRVPALYFERDFAEAGGLMSYGPNISEQYRLLGVYAGRILGGQKPGDLPVRRVTKLEFVINLKTAKALGLIIPETLLATADEVIQ